MKFPGFPLRLLTLDRLNGRTELSKIMTKDPFTSISSGSVEIRGHGVSLVMFYFIDY